MIHDADKKSLLSGEYRIQIAEAKFYNTTSRGTRTNSGYCEISVDKDGYCSAKGVIKIRPFDEITDSVSEKVGTVRSAGDFRIEGESVDGKCIVALGTSRNISLIRSASQWGSFSARIFQVNITNKEMNASGGLCRFFVDAVLSDFPKLLDSSDENSIEGKGAMCKWKLWMVEKALRARIYFEKEMELYQWYRAFVVWLFPICGTRSEPRAIQMTLDGIHTTSIFSPHYFAGNKSLPPLLAAYQEANRGETTKICSSGLDMYLTEQKSSGPDAEAVNFNLFWAAFAVFDVEVSMTMSAIAIEAFARRIYQKSHGDLRKEKSDKGVKFLSEIDDKEIKFCKYCCDQREQDRSKVGITKTVRAMLENGIVTDEQFKVWRKWRSSLAHGRDPKATWTEGWIARIRLEQMLLRLYCFAIGLGRVDVNSPYAEDIMTGISSAIDR